MTVKEGDRPNSYVGPYPMSKLSPVLATNYYEHLIHDKSDSSFVQAWDLMLGVHNLSATIAKLKKALDKKNGIEEKEYDTKEMYHMQIDA